MLADFILELSSAPGNATTINLAGAVADRKAFASQFANGAPVFYVMDDGTQAEWGAGVFNTGSPNTLTRSQVFGNTSNTASRLNFAGSTRVYNELPAPRVPYVDNSGTLKVPSGGRLDTMSGATPIGASMVYWGVNAPAGWLFCNGNWVSRTGYAALFSAIGTIYGAGDGSTSFALPDLRGRVVVGMDNMGGMPTANRVTSILPSHTLGGGGGDQWMQSHDHPVWINDAAHAHSIADPGHAHGVADPGHAHALNGPAQLGGSYGGYAAPSTGVISVNNLNWSTDGRFTGIALALNGTGIGIYAAWAGIGPGTVYASGAGQSQNCQPSIVSNHIIYAGA